jgi:hemoglobin
MTERQIPTLYEWAGGLDALSKLTEIFYAKVLADEFLRPVFEHMHEDHPKRVAHFLGEVLGGPPTYSEAFGGHSRMLSQHLNRGLTEDQRRRWVELLLDSADVAGLPSDPEFRSAFVSYIEWGTRLAVINSQPGVNPTPDEPMPRWGWGETKGPYQP